MDSITAPHILIALLAALSGYIGALLFSAAVVAPLAVKILTPELTAAFLRPFWMSYHRFGMYGALLLTVVGTLAATYSAAPSIYIIALLSTGSLMTLCFFVGLNLIPRINHAADTQNHATFDSLHKADMALVGTGLMTGLATTFFLGYAVLINTA